MLQQILQDMFIEPQLLAELDEEQKQLLFLKLREEQIRRWKERENSLSEAEKKVPFVPSKPRSSNGGKRKVDFLTGKDGQPWTWVMGEHPEDRSVEEILESEAQEKAMRLAVQEIKTELGNKLEKSEDVTVELPKQQHQVEEQQQQKDDQQQKKQEEDKQTESRTDCAGSAGRETRQKPALPPNKPVFRASVVPPSLTTTTTTTPTTLTTTDQQDEPLKRLLRPASSRIIATDKNMEDLAKRRSMEIYKGLMEVRAEVSKQSLEQGRDLEQTWQEQEQLSRQVEEERRRVVRTVREHYTDSLRKVRTESQVITALASGMLRLASIESTSSQLSDRPSKPESIEAVIGWFREEEEPRKAGIEPRTGQVADWFHGIISREEAETLIGEKPVGTFLVRVSDRIWGYVLSYRSAETGRVGGASGSANQSARCKHFLIDTGRDQSDGGYHFFGANHIVHDSLADLVKFHSTTPISFTGQELLKQACGQLTGQCDYERLYSTLPPLTRPSNLIPGNTARDKTSAVAALPHDSIKYRKESSDL